MLQNQSNRRSQSGEKISQEANQNSTEKQANKLKRGKTRVTGLRMVLALNMIVREDTTNSHDQSSGKESKTKAILYHPLQWTKNCSSV